MSEPVSGRSTVTAAVALAAIGVSVGAWSVATFRLLDGVDEAATVVNRAMLLHLWSGTAVAWVALTALMLALWKTGANWTPPLHSAQSNDTAARAVARPSFGHGFRAAAWVVLMALALRITVLLLHVPTLNDQLPRHMLDAGTAAAGVNPHLATPAQRFDALRPPGTSAADGPIIRDRPADWADPTHPEPRFEGELESVLAAGHPYLHSLTAPGAMHALATTRRLTSSTADPAFVWRSVATFADLGVIVMLLVLLRMRNRSAWWAAAYAWHPLPLLEIAGAGHVESLGLLVMLVAFALAGSVRGRDVSKWSPWSALALSVRPLMALPALVLLLRERTRRERAVAVAIVVGVMLVLGAPLLLTDGAVPLMNVLASSRDYLAGWTHYSATFTVMEPMLGRLATAIACAIVFAMIATVVWRRVADPVAATRIVLTALLVLSPIVHPWFVLWPLALLPIRMGAVAWVLSLTVLVAYAARQDPLVETPSATVVIVGYTPVLITALAVAAVGVRRRGAGRR